MKSLFKWAISALVFVVCTTAQAEQRLSFGGWSHHLFTDYDYSETHRILLYQKSVWFWGTFDNSFSEESYVLGKEVWKTNITEYWEAYLAAGAIYGYRHCFRPIDDISSKNVCPALIPGTRYTRWKLEPDIKLVANALVFNLNWRF